MRWKWTRKAGALRSDLPYVFIIGFNKTGTSSLHHLFSSHGWPSIHWHGGRLARRMFANASEGLATLKGYDRRYRVFSDMTMISMDCRIEANSLFPALHRHYPDAYFVLNTRGEQGWLDSRSKMVVKVSGTSFPEHECRISGLDDADAARAKWRNERQDFEARVESYFAGSSRFLRLDIERDDVPRLLGQLLGFEFDPAKWKSISTNVPRDPNPLT